MKQPRTRKFDAVGVTATVIALIFLLAAAGVSFTHIVDTADTLGLRNWQHWVPPWFIDGFALLGKLGRLPRFERFPRIRLWGLIIMCVCGAISLACNVYAGDTPGEQLFGVLTIGVFIGAETYATVLLDAVRAEEDVEAAPIPSRARRMKTDEERLEDRRRRAKYYEMNTQDRANWTREDNRRQALRKQKELESIETSYTLPEAQVSPAGPVVQTASKSA